MKDSVGLIGKEVEITGQLNFEGDLRIEGNVNGSIQSSTGTVSIGKSGQVIADIQASVVIVEGHIKGDINASSRLEIARSGHVEGNLITQKLQISEGGIFEGKLEMLD